MRCSQFLLFSVRTFETISQRAVMFVFLLIALYKTNLHVVGIGVKMFSHAFCKTTTAEVMRFSFKGAVAAFQVSSTKINVFGRSLLNVLCRTAERRQSSVQTS